MTFASFISLLKFLPMLLDFATQIEDLIAKGVQIEQIKAAMKSIDVAFAQKNTVERAKEINDTFRKP